MYEINDQWMVVLMKQEGGKATEKEATMSKTKASKKEEAGKTSSDDKKVKESRLFWMKSGLIVKAVGQGFCLPGFVSQKFW